MSQPPTKTSQPPTFLVTRPQPDNQETVQRLKKLGLNTLSIPLLKSKPIDFALPDIANFCAIIITSSNTLRALEKAMVLPTLTPLPLFVVGEKTAKLAASLGFTSITTAKSGIDELNTQIIASTPRGQIFYPSATDITAPTPLQNSGIKIHQLPIYKMDRLQTLNQTQRNKIAQNTPLPVMFYSQRTAKIFITLFSEYFPQNLANIIPLCLSQNITFPLLAAGYKNVYVAQEPNENAMIRLTRTCFATRAT